MFLQLYIILLSFLTHNKLKLKIISFNSKMGNKSIKDNKRSSTDIINKLTKCEHVEKYSLEGLKTYAKVTNIYDGDTCHLIFDFHTGKTNNTLVDIRVRMAHYNSAEIKTNDKEEKEKAIEARDYFRKICDNKIVYVEFGKYEKYGRPLVVLYFKKEHCGNLNKSINFHMMDMKMGKKYEGKGEKEY